METLRRLLTEWFTGKGNESFEIGRALWAFSILMGIIYAGIAIFYNHQAFNMIEYGGGLGALLFGGGVGIAAKDRGGMATGPKVVVSGDANVDQRQGGE